MSHFNVLSNAFLQSKYNSMWQNRIEYEEKSQLMWQNGCETEDVPMEESENQENIEKECWLSNTNMSSEGEEQNSSSLYHQMQQRMKKKSQIKRVTWNKNLIDVKFISPRISRKRPQFMPVNNSVKLMQKCSNSAHCVQSCSIITNRDVQIPQASTISRKEPSISFKEKCQKFKLKNKDSGLVLSLNSNLYS
jgi:hypothetical protein